MNDEITKRIRALLAKAAGTSNVHEAEAFAAKAHELLAKHNLALADLAEEDAPDREVWETPQGVPDAWARNIWVAVATTYFCKPLEAEAGSKRFIQLIGAPHNVAVTVEMSKYLIHTVRRLAKRHSAASSLRRSFCNGACWQLCIRLEKIRTERQQPNTCSTGSNLPAVYETEQRRNEAHAAKLYGKMKQKRSRSTRADPSFLAGSLAAKAIGLDQQVSQATETTGAISASDSARGAM
ncbi:DUF2786 domain-containing protein [uncultured Roseibium sp.]|uniref:DUF2786 domain-containing protein n=1 Tax=uncultured Roseibium sp. TaxID=1936171 RepID=UPI002633D8D0|nr:DUF2786 domain-containing protein [uncultured Roseibium sp.]